MHDNDLFVRLFQLAQFPGCIQKEKADRTPVWDIVRGEVRILGKYRLENLNGLVMVESGLQWSPLDLSVFIRRLEGL